MNRILCQGYIPLVQLPFFYNIKDMNIDRLNGQGVNREIDAAHLYGRRIEHDFSNILSESLAYQDTEDGYDRLYELLYQWKAWAAAQPQRDAMLLSAYEEAKQDTHAASGVRMAHIEFFEKTAGEWKIDLNSGDAMHSAA